MDSNLNGFQKWMQKGLIGKSLSIFTSLFTLGIFITLIVFLFKEAIPAFNYYHIFDTTDFDLSSGSINSLGQPIKGTASIWMPLSITLLVSLISILIATPIGIKTATFIKYRMSSKNSKRAFIIVQTLAGIPSVIFGLFALTSLGTVVRWIFQMESVYSIVNATIMLSFMILPTIISLTINTYDGIDKEYLLNPVSLGLSKTSAIYKVIRKDARGGIIVAVIMAIGRTIGETVALSMILNNSDSYAPITNGANILTQSLGTMGSVIASNLFSESGNENMKSVLYLFGLFLLILIFILNTIIMYITSVKNKNKKTREKLFKFHKFVADIFLWVPRNLSYWYYELRAQRLGIDCRVMDTNEFISKKIENDKFINARSYWLMFWEYLCAFISFGFLSWIIIYIAIKGLGVVGSTDSTLFQYTKNTTGQAFLNTIIIVLVSLAIGIPIALLTTIYLLEYCKQKWINKFAFFCVDSFSSSPSIIFGMFGLSIFIQTFGWTSSGTVGRSLIAGALTIVIVVLPTLIRMFEQAFRQVPQQTRESGLAMGMSRWKVAIKIIIPGAYKSMVSSVVLVTGKIMSETAPLYLTAGLSGSSYVSLLNPGQTLTTRIYAQTISSNSLNDFDSSFESALASLLLMLLLIYLGYILIPNWKVISEDCKNAFISQKKMFSHEIAIDKHIIDHQIVKKTLYISYTQMKENNLDKKIDKKVILNNKIYKIKYLQDERIQKMMFIKNIYV